MTTGSHKPRLINQYHLKNKDIYNQHPIPQSVKKSDIKIIKIFREINSLMTFITVCPTGDLLN